MKENLLTHRVRKAWREKKRLVVPLMGFPGLTLTGASIKLAQQNYGEHFRVLRALADRFHPDVLFPLMDLAVEANAMGRYTVFPVDDSATVVTTAFDERELTRIRSIRITFDTRVLGYVETLKLMAIGLPDGILRGAFVIGPYTLAALLVGAEEAALATLTRPDVLSALCELTTERIQEYARMLIAAGAQIICILEPTAVMLGPEAFQRFSADFVYHINNSCKYNDVATIYHTCGNTMHLIGKMAASGVDALSLDAEDAGVSLELAARRLEGDTLIMGNVSPSRTLLHGSPAQVRKEVLNRLRSMDFCSGYILSTGCDMPQETPLENIQAFMDTGRAYRVGA
jgi:uroporphyrinogen decarboxylase